MVWANLCVFPKPKPRKANNENYNYLKEDTPISKTTIYLVLCLVCAIWGGAFASIKYLLNYLTPVQLVTYRYLMASLFFAAILIFKSKKEIIDLVKNHCLRLCVVAFFGVIGYNVALAYGEVRIASGTASIIINLSPIFTLIIAVLFLKEETNIFKTIGVGLSFIGLIVIVIFGPEPNINLSYFVYVLITVLAPLSWALYTTSSKALSRKYDSVIVTGLSIIAGTLPLVFTLRSGDIKIISELNFASWMNLIFLSGACTIIGFTGWVWALKKIPSNEVASFVYLIPVFALAFGRIFFQEPINAGIIAGAAMLLAGVHLVNKKINGKVDSAK